jgi:hypothetical protein
LERLNIVTYQDKIKWRGPRYRSPVVFGQQGQDRIGELIAQGRPLMISRLGSVELSCLHFYLKRRTKSAKNYSKKIGYSMSNNAGFFPVEDDKLDAFCEMYLEDLKNVDVLGVWFNHYENVICNTLCRDAELADLACLEPFRFTNPWSGKLAGKKVLVVHPFADSIRKQYQEKRHLLFSSPDVLPEFELKTLKAVQSIAGCQVAFPTWFDAYHHMCDEMARTDFDICLIGAGAYGLPLASCAKKLGKQALHMGGVTQILFGIKGRRWERDDYADFTAKMFNEHWIRPLESEAPANKDKVEKGCYW